MSSVVQSSTRLGFAGNASVNLTLNGVAAGNSIIVVCAAYGDTNGPTITANDGSAYSSIQGRRASAGSSATAAILWLHNVGAGNKTITVSTDTSALFRYGWARAMEVSGLVNAAPNVTMPAASGANGNNSNAPSTGNSAATSAANCFVVAAVAVSGGGTDAGIDTPATTGYTNWWVDQDFNAEQAGAGDYKVVTATGAQSAAWGTLTGSYPWAAALAAFEEVSAGGATEIDQQGEIALQGTLSISGDLAFEVNIPVDAAGPIALVGDLGIAGDIVYEIKRWRVPTSAPQGTSVHVMVFSGSSPTYALLAQGVATVDASGFADIPGTGTIGTEAFAFVHNYDDDTNTASIYGGAGIATLVDVG